LPRWCLPSWSGRQLHAHGGGGDFLARAWQWPCWRAWHGSYWVARQGSCRGTPSSPARILPGVSWASPVRTLPRIIASLSSFDLDCSLSSQRSAYHHRGASQVLSQCICLTLVGSKVAHSTGVGRAAPARVLPGPLRLPRQGSLPGQPALPVRPFVASVLVVALFVLCLQLLSGFPLLSCLCVWPSQVALTARAQVKGSKAHPLLLYTDTSPIYRGRGPLPKY